jgi:hypothetical protein
MKKNSIYFLIEQAKKKEISNNSLDDEISISLDDGEGRRQVMPSVIPSSMVFKQQIPIDDV